MKKVIISFFVMLVLTMTTVLTAEAVKIDNENQTLGGIKTVSIHVFYDVNENGVQDTDNPKEGDAIGFYVWVTPAGWPGTAQQFRVGQTNEEGDLTTVDIDTDEFMMHAVRFVAREKIRNAPAQYKGDVGGITGMVVTEGMKVNIPVVYEDSLVKTKNIIHNRFSHIFDLLGLSEFFINSK